MSPGPHKPRIYDCFTYYNEELLLRLRLETLHEVVDRFVIAEAPYTHTGKPKPLLFEPSRFREFADKIVHVIVDDMPVESGDSWANENHQRNALARGLGEAQAQDWVIVSDVDEIPRPEAIRRYRPWYLSGTFAQRFYCYFINNLAVQARAPGQPRWWIRPKITTIGHLRNFWGSLQNLRIPAQEPGLSGSLRHLHRKLRHQHLNDGGWHFSWMMTPEQMIDKIESYAHTEHDHPHIKSVEAIRSAIQQGNDIFGKGERFRLVDVDESFPPYLRENFEQFRPWYMAPSTGIGANLSQM
jgi:beta-1,4-mannosyl-glycoprotein beta-1,4-N-acetylglucosaminyltransferase